MELRLRPVLLVLLPLLPLLPALYTAPSLRRLATQQAAPHLPSDIWKTCSGGKYPVRIDSVSLYPDPPKRGRRLSLLAELRLDEVVANGSVSVELKYGVFALIQKAWPLCEFVRSNHRHCPLEKGPLRIEFNGTVPKLWPSGHFTGRAVALDQNSTELLCVDVDFHM